MTDLEHVNEAVSEASSQAASKAGKYLTFRLATEEYGLEILKVREIIGLMDITRVPKAPSDVRGVINLRGKVIPVLDLRTKFMMESIPDTEQTCIIVVDALVDGGSMVTGIVVDSVSEVLDIQGEQIEDSPDFGVGVDTDFILGIGKIKDEVKILLDIDKVLDGTEMSGMGGTASDGMTSEEMMEEAMEGVGA